MKKFKTLSLLALFLIVGLFSCQKPIIFVEGSGPGGGNVPGTTPGNGAVYMKGKVNGVMLECTNVTAALMPISETQNALQILGFKGNEGFNLMLNNYKGIGTYDLFSDIGTYVGNILDPNMAYHSESGTVRITEATSKYAKGFFEFKGINGDGEIKTITEGSFQISLVFPTAPTPSTGDKSFTAKINGIETAFVAEGIYTNIPGIGPSMQIIGTNGDKYLLLFIDSFNGLGVYEMKNGSMGSYTEDLTPTGSYSSQDVGKITVTGYTTTTIKGTFEFEAPNEDSSLSTKKTITAGKFEIPYKKM